MSCSSKQTICNLVSVEFTDFDHAFLEAGGVHCDWYYAGDASFETGKAGHLNPTGDTDELNDSIPRPSHIILIVQGEVELNYGLSTFDVRVKRYSIKENTGLN